MKKVTDLKDLNKEQMNIIDYEIFSPSDSSRVVFNQEVVYQEYESLVETSILFTEPIIQNFNTLYNNNYYGKINNKNQFILPNPSFIVEIPGTNGTHYALNFVKDAYVDFQEKWNKIVKKNTTLDYNYIYNVSPKKSFVNFEEKYLEIIKKHYEQFSEFVKIKQFESKVINFSQFINIFAIYISIIANKHPITLQSYISSNACDRHISGLCIDIVDMDVNSYSEKVTNFLANRNFPILSQVAGSFGFIIDKNIPWKLIANVESNEMKKYKEKYTSNKIYDYFFVKVKDYNFFYFKKYVMEIYNMFVDNNPQFIKTETKMCNNLFKVKTNKINRIKIEEKEFINNLNQNTMKWWRLFLFVTIQEKKLQMSQNQFEKIVISTYQVAKVDIQKAMRYVETEIANFPLANSKNNYFNF